MVQGTRDSPVPPPALLSALGKAAAEQARAQRASGDASGAECDAPQTQSPPQPPANELLFQIKDGPSTPHPALSGPRPCHQAGVMYACPAEMNSSGCRPMQSLAHSRGPPRRDLLWLREATWKEKPV